MSGRDDILRALRRAAPPPLPLPEWSGRAMRFDDPVSSFLKSVAAVAGTPLRVPDLAAADAAVRGLETWTRARLTASLVPGVGRSSLDLDSVGAPQDLRDLEVAVVSGAPAVAENGAVWIPGSRLGRHRAVFVIAEHLVLVVKAEDVVHTMHQAYDRIRLERPGWGCFVSGPSKTADIEQALVIGAHGARSCAVVVVG
ncbi:MAG TPA: LUD domain-containing protein [Anaeromyxobacteraceae bacterium]|nr:LUD domain-containing protein [Anaeromyxobacteraceae bacterium]